MNRNEDDGVSSPSRDAGSERLVSEGKETKEDEQHVADERKSEDDNTARVERRRHMNMIHSRRKRQRRKIEVEVLKEQVETLSRQNTRLRTENQILEQAVAQARQLGELFDQQRQLNDQQGDKKPAAVRADSSMQGRSNATFGISSPAQLLQNEQLLQNLLNVNRLSASVSQGAPFLPQLGVGLEQHASAEHRIPPHNSQQQLTNAPPQPQVRLDLATLLELTLKEKGKKAENAKPSPK